MAALHAVIAVLVFASARRVGVRRWLALAAPLIDLPLAYSALSQASPHWVGTALTTALLAALLHPRWRARPFWLGIGTGLLLAAQHQKGVVIGGGVAAVLVLDGLLPRRYGLPAPPLVGTLARYAAGIGAVVTLVFGPLLVLAGVDALYDALVRLPLQGYRAYHAKRAWGENLLGASARGIGGYLLTWLPAFVPLVLASGVWAVARRRNRETARARLVIGVLGAAALLSVAYNPDAVHITLILPVVLLATVERLEAALAAIERTPFGRVASWFVGLSLTAAAVALLVIALRYRQRLYPTRADTPIGRVDFADDTEVRLLRRLEDRLRAAPAREVFGYPFYASLYLLADARNPSRFQVLTPGYSPPEHIAEAILSLETRRTPYVVVLTYFVDWQNDEFIRYLQQRYERVPVEGIEPLGAFVLFRRRP
jgi:hypothetical protein